MEKPTRERDRVAIAFVGKFNSPIFQPSWLALHDLIRNHEAESADLKIIHPDISDFSLGWLDLQVTPVKFLATANISHVHQVLDLVQGIFTLLEHTPVTKLGLNRLFDYRMPSPDRYHAFGHRLAPKQEWEGFLDTPGLLSLTMAGVHNGSPSKSVQVRTEPSGFCPPGIFFEVNETFESEGPGSVRQLLHWLREHWGAFEKYSEGIVEHLTSLE
jgi:hypothetical protein